MSELLERFICFLDIFLSMQDTITIPRKEYQRLKALEKIEWDIVGEFKQALKDLKDGKFIEC